MSRVDRLDEPTRHVLQVAAVIGRSFEHHLIGRGPRRRPRPRRHPRRPGAPPADPLPPDAPDERRTAPDASSRSASTSSPTRSCRKRSTSRCCRERAKRSIGTWRAPSSGSTPIGWATSTACSAYHYSRGDEPAKAEEYLFKAGDEAARTAASSEALGFFREASRLYLQMHGDGGDPAEEGAAREEHRPGAPQHRQPDRVDRALRRRAGPARRARAAEP